MPIDLTSAAHSISSIARRREDAPFRLRGVLNLMSGPPDPLKSNRYRARRSNLTDEIDGSNIDAQLERGCGDHGLQLAGFQPFLGRQPQLARQTSVVREHGVFAETLAEMVCDSFRKAPRVHEHQRRSVLLNQRVQPVVNLLPHLVRGDRSELIVRALRRRDPSPGDGHGR